MKAPHIHVWGAFCYPLIMAVNKITRSGSNLILHMSNGSQLIAYKGTNTLWYPSNGANPDPDPGPGTDPGPVPDSLTVTNCEGESLTLNKSQLEYASTIRKEGAKLSVGSAGVIIAFMTVLVESKFLMYANSNVPGSLSYPHDAVGSDHDSLGLFQQRPSMGWGNTAELMNVGYNARAFFGGPSGPNYPSPRGLIDIPGWKTMSKGEAAQAVQVSAFPDRYACWEQAATDIYNALVTPDPGPGPGGEDKPLVWPFLPAPSNEGGDMPPTGSSDAPLAEYGPRVLTGNFHEGIDFGYGSALGGAEIHAAGAGEVVIAGWDGNWGNSAVIFHGTVQGKDIYTRYAHMRDTPRVSVGQQISRWTVLGYIGSTGASFGNHLHWETHECEPGQGMVNNNINPDAFRTATNPRDFMAKYGQYG